MMLKPNRKKIILLSPPVFCPREPYLALPTLKAFLAQFGYEVMQKDVNLETFDKILSRAYLSKYRDAIEQTVRGLKRKFFLDDNDRKKLKFLRKTLHFAPQIINKINAAKNNLKAGNKKSVPSYRPLNYLKRLWSFIIVTSGFDIINARYYPTKLSFSNLDMRYMLASSDDILKAAEDREENLFIDFFEQQITPDILQNDPLLVGISINDQQQIIPGLTLANLIKRKNIYVTIGGAVFTKDIEIHKEFFRLCDSFIINEGEHALLSLVRQVEGDKQFQEVPNLVWNDKINGKIIFNELNYKEELDLLPTPDFTGLPLDSYFTFFREEVRLPLLVAKGCYWNKCAFCDIMHKMPYKERSINRIIEDIGTLIKKHNARSIVLASPSICPKTLRELSEGIIKNKIIINWEGYARFEEDFNLEFCRLLATSGCKNLFMGLESGVQRILDFLEKGIKVSSLKNILRNLHQAGIAVHMFVMVGIPTESKIDAANTIKFILDNKDVLDVRDFSLMLTTFYCSRHTKLFKAPHNYHIQEIRVDNPRDDLETWRKYVAIAPGGMSLEESRKMTNSFYGIIDKKFYYFGLTRVVWEEKLLPGNAHHKFCLLLAKFIKHKISCDLENSWRTIIVNRFQTCKKNE